MNDIAPSLVDKFMRALLKLGTESGASDKEIRAGGLEFASALRQGCLCGHELRIVMYNLPELAKAIAAELGVNVNGSKPYAGELLKLGRERKITRSVMFNTINKLVY